jgi:hypothetical protein
MSVAKAVKYVLLISTYARSVQVCEKANQSAYVPVVFSRQIRKIVCNVRFSVRSASWRITFAQNVNPIEL